MSYIFPYLSEKCHIYANYNHYTSKQPVLSPDRKLEPDDQARQSGTDNESTAVTFMMLSLPDFVHGISRAFDILKTVVHSAQKQLLNGKRFCD